MKLFLLNLISIFSFVSAKTSGRCYTPDEYRGECIPFKSCHSLFTLAQNNPNDEKYRLFISLSQCGFHDGEPLVCCYDRFAVIAAPSPHTMKPKTVSPPIIKPAELLDFYGLLPKSPDCGTDFENRIYGGNVTEIDEFSWTTLLGYSKPQNLFGFHCGGSLINSRYVITASHCVNGKDIPDTWILSFIRLGEWDRSTENDCDERYRNERICSPPPVDIAIEERISHPNYDPYSVSEHYDIALLRLSQEVTFSEYIKPICLPIEKSLRDLNLIRETLTVAGWGKTESNYASSVKLKVNVNGVSNEECHRLFKLENRPIVDHQLCAGGTRGEDSCKGDSGGPLMRLNNKGVPPYWYLAGIEGWPGVYTRVGKYVDWIAQTIHA